MVKRLYVHGVSGHDVGALDLIPQAILRKSLEDISDEYGIGFEDDADDLDAYKVAYFETEGVVLALMRHQGETDDSVNLYLPRGLRHSEAEKYAATVMKKFDIPSDLLEWLS